MSAIDATIGITDWGRSFDDYEYFAHRVLGVRLHPGQLRWLKGSSRRENLLVTGNRWGKSFVCAVKLLHHAVYRPRNRRFDNCGRYRMVTAAITQDQASIIFNQVVRFVRQSAVLSELVESIVRTPFPTIRFANGSVIEARSTQNKGEYLLGNDYDLFIFDEVAFESDPEYVVEEVILMRLADREGVLDLVSTPCGRNWFYRRAREIQAGRRPGYFQSGDSRENTAISKDFLRERLTYFTDRRVKQNIMGQFVDSGGEVIPGRDIDQALETYSESAADVLRNEPGPEVRYLTGWDLARKRTATVGVTVALKGGMATVVELKRLRHIDWTVIIHDIEQQQVRYPGRLVVDATGLGDVVVSQLGAYNPESVIFSAPNKAELLTNVELFHARGKIAYPRYELPDGVGKTWSFEDELRGARWDDNNECDSLMALALALWPLRRRDIPQVGPRVGRV